MDYTEGDVQRLADKIDGLELSEGEAAALSALLAAAEDSSDDVVGFGVEPGPFRLRIVGIVQSHNSLVFNDSQKEIVVNYGDR